MRLVQSRTEGAFWVWDQDHQGVVIESGTWWDEQIRSAIDQAAAPAKWAIDIGASIGWFTCYMAKSFARVVSVEAHPGTFEILTRNVREVRGLDESRVLLLQGAAYDRAQGMRLATGGMVGWPMPDDLNQTPSASSIAFIPSLDIEPLVQTLVLDESIPEDAPVGLVKVDAQGCDLRALRGLRKTLARCRPRVIFEFEQTLSSWHGDAWDDYLEFFKRAGYGAPQVVPGGSIDFVVDPV
jgi:FkbM family methyltransferase